MAEMAEVMMDDKLRKQLNDIFKKVSNLIKEEVEKISDNAGERIVITHTLIENLYLSDQQAISMLGLEMKMTKNMSVAMKLRPKCGFCNAEIKEFPAMTECGVTIHCCANCGAILGVTRDES